jgi:hypothetical protein
MRKGFSLTAAGLLIAASLVVSSVSYAEPPAGKGKKDDQGSVASDKHAGKPEKADKANKADKSEKHANKGKKEKSGHGVIGSDDLQILRDFLKEDHAKNCPPGLAKKDNGCLPPGIAKKYAVGQTLPDGVKFSDLPAALLKKLHPVAGHKYGKVDNDVVLISEATKKVVDAVSLISAIK